MKAIIYISFLVYSITTCGQNNSVRPYKTFNDFYNKITDNKYLRFTNIDLTDTATSLKKLSNDSLEVTFTLKLNEYNLKYIVDKKVNDIDSYSNPSFILFNNQKILLDSNTSFEGLSITSANKTILGTTTYLVLSSWAPGCNGTFCRAEYNQLFQLKDGKVKYQIVDGWQSPSNIFCDLNNDGQLDLISFIGKCVSKKDSVESINPDKYYFCIQALTLVAETWMPLTDKNKIPYYIYMQVDDFFELDTFKIIDYNWITEL